MATFSGRLVNFLSRRLPTLMHRGGKRQVTQFRASNGSKGNMMMGKPVFVLDVAGRKTGESRPVALMLVRRGDELVVTGSYGGNPKAPNWYQNLLAAGEAHVEVGSERWPVSFRQLDQGAEREECWQLLCDAYPDFATYQELTDRRLPVGVLTRKAG